MVENSQGKRIRNAFAYVRYTMLDVRFINNVRVAQIFFGSLMYAEILLEPSFMMTAGYHDF